MPDQDNDERLKQIESRLTAIESRLGMRLTSNASKQQTNQPAGSHLPAFLFKPGNWLGFIAVICFIVAAGFIIKLSIDSGWLTPLRQIGLAYLFGATLVALGLYLINIDREYGSFLPAAGIIILFLTTFAANQYYYLLSFQLALAVTSLISLFCIFVYFRIRHDIYFLISALGAYLSPLIIGYHAQPAFVLYYYLLCSFTFAILSIWLRSRLLIITAAYLAIVVNGSIGFDPFIQRLITFILPVHFLIFCIANYLFSNNHKQSLTEYEAWAFFPVLLAFYSLEYYFINLTYHGYAPWMSLIFAGFIFGLYLSAKEKFGKTNLPSEAMIFAFLTVVLFHSIYLELVPAEFKTWLLAIFLVIAAMLPTRHYTRFRPSVLAIPLLAIFVIISIEYISLLWDLLHDTAHRTESLGGLAAFLAAWGLILRQSNFLATREELSYVLLSSAHLLAITGLYNLTHDISSLAVSASWLLYAMGVMGLAYARKDKIMATSAIFVLITAAGKALLFDASSAPTTIRILCLLLTGAVLYGAGFLMKRIGRWKSVA